MKRLTCEMCGSTELMKQDGVFVCQTCGTKYSVEEAKKMMVEGTVEVAGTVKVDDSAKIANYYTMAENAYDAGNQKEAEQYCNKIIEIDPTHAEAWLLKGIVSGWQSTGANLRMDEFISCATNAFTNANSVEILNDLAQRAYQQYYSLTLAINKLKVDSVVSYSKNYREYIQLPPTFLMWGIQIQIAYGTAFNKFYAEKPEEEKKKPMSLGTELGLNDVSEKCEAGGLFISLYSETGRTLLLCFAASSSPFVKENGSLPNSAVFLKSSTMASDKVSSWGARIAVTLSYRFWSISKTMTIMGTFSSLWFNSLQMHRQPVPFRHRKSGNGLHFWILSGCMFFHNLYALGALLGVPMEEILVPTHPELNIVFEQQDSSCCSKHLIGRLFWIRQNSEPFRPFLTLQS